MHVRDFDFELPEELIARHPVPERSASRLLHLDGPSGAIAHRRFTDLLDLAQAGDLLVFNNTRVIPARLFGHKESGGKVEVLVERMTGDHAALAHVRANKTPKVGARLHMDGGIDLEVVGRDADLFRLVCHNDRPLVELLEQHGHMPLPPYIDREDDADDRDRYQTVYAERRGAVAAPTAGLHFDRALLDKLAAKGVDSTFVTLHVGAGTFQPVKAEQVEDHVMHSEWIDVPAEVVDAVRATRARGGRVIAVGTTSVRSLETAARDGDLAPYTGDTNIFIYPGYRFRVVDALVTNFHLPQSTLIMLVSAFAGRDAVMAAYRAAIDERYRFFSYGDAMFVTRNPRLTIETQP